MKLLIKYNLREFFIAFSFGLIFFCLIFLISEFFFRLTDFIKYHATFFFILRYLLLHIPLWIRDSMPISILFGIIFSLNRLQRDNEITALKSCAVNLHSFLLPLVILSLVFVLIGIMLNFNIVPEVFQKAKEMREFELRGEKISDQKKCGAVDYWTADGIHFESSNFDFESKTMYDVRIDRFSRDYSLIEQLIAKKMVYENGRWILEDIINRRFSPDGKELVMEQRLNSETLRISESPEDFLPQSKDVDMMSIYELKSSIDRKLRRNITAGKELVAYHLRFAYPFASFVVVFIGIPFAFGLSGKFAKIRGLGYVLFISFIYWILISVGRVLGEAGLLPAFLSAWLANIVFLILGLVLFSKISR